MSTFQKFKQGVHHNKSQQSRISQKSIKNQSGIFTLSFNTNQIMFNYSQMQIVLVNADLVLTNMSDQSIYFKIRSNNPQYYQILPQQEILYPSATARIIFKLRRDKLIVSPNQRYANNLAKLLDKVNGNLFQVQWTVINEEQIKTNFIPEPKYSQALKVMINQQQIISKDRKISESKVKRYPEQISSRSSKDQSWKLINSRKELLKDVSNKDFELNLHPNLDEERQSLLRLPIIILVAVVSFFVGYIIA